MFSTVNEYSYYKIALYDLTDEQKSKALQMSNTAAIIYNWGIEFCKKHYEETGKYPKFIGMSLALAEYIKSPEHSWMSHIPKYTRDSALHDLDAAYQKFFNKLAKYPKPKKVSNEKLRFAVRHDRISFHGKNHEYVRIPGLSTRNGNFISCKNHRIPVGKDIVYNNVRIKYDGIHWWLSIAVKLRKPFIEEDPIEYVPDGEGFGIDVGIRTSAYLSNGISFDFPYKHRIEILEHRRDKLRSAIDKVKKQERSSSHIDGCEVKTSKRQLKRMQRYRKTRRQIKNIYNTYYHQVSRQIADMKPAWICIETLQVRKIQKSNPYTSKYVHESRLAGFLDKIDYKCRENGTKVIRAPREYPSSQICSKCGTQHKIGDSKVFKCPNCGLVIDRDLNAALNLRNYGVANPQPYM